MQTSNRESLSHFEEASLREGKTVVQNLTQLEVKNEQLTTKKTRLSENKRGSHETQV